MAKPDKTNLDNTARSSPNNTNTKGNPHRPSGLINLDDGDIMVNNTMVVLLEKLLAFLNTGVLREINDEVDSGNDLN
uniref:Uncharacterized protein n=1 Tax=Tanacetum cinerariifolium TaxID=118510 RepID=A0A699L3V0_TANCI|nr:hypothetical protein [Tanacetum cinerariifolium]